MTAGTKSTSNEFGELLHAKMRQKEISMTALGKTIGVHRTTISDYTSGKYLPKEETFHRIHQVIPDKELYDAYLRAVNQGEPRKNKQLIPEATPYNYYKADAEDMKAAEEVFKKSSTSSTSDDTYIYIALSQMVTFFEETNLCSFAPTDYAAYLRLKEQYKNK